MRELYQLSLERPAGRYTDAEWRKELAARKQRNANYELQYKNFTKKQPVAHYVAWLDGAN